MGVGFAPDWSSPPGDTIKELMREQGHTLTTLYYSLGIATIDIVGLLSGKVPINLELAVALDRVFGGTPEFWMRREANYRTSLADMGPISQGEID